jgi:hypothetical protein
MNHKEKAQKLVDYSLNLLSIQYNSDGGIMTRSECLPKAKMIAISHISFTMYQASFSPDSYDYWEKVKEEIDKCF